MRAAANTESIAAEHECCETRVVTITVPGDFAFRGLISRAAATVCKLAASNSAGATQFCDEVVSAVGEAFNNAVLHAYDAKRGDVTLKVAFDSTRVVVDLIDDGAAFNLESVPDYVGNDPQESGMGLFIIRSFVDQLTYEAGPPNCLRMIKRLPTP
jgi:serine/threonine-protein kinase RsbW